MQFDRTSFPGGDHFYGLLEPRRESLDGDLSMQSLDDRLWPKFSRHSVERLMELGFSRADAEAYFPDAKQR